MTEGRDPVDTEPASEAHGPADIETPVELAQRLSALKDRSGRSLRELAAAVSRQDGTGAGNPHVYVLHNTLGDWCSGRHLPGIRQHEAFRRFLCELGVDDPEPWVDALNRVRKRSARVSNEPAPYKGLESFGRDDADRFFGRDGLVARTIGRLGRIIDDGSPRLLWVVGPSGSGKSSLLHAGVVGALERQGMTCVSMTPGATPCYRLSEVLASQPSSDADPVLDGDAVGPLRCGPGSLPAAGGGDVNAVEHVVMIDQFEELFTECGADEERERFLDAIARLTDPGPGRGYAVVVGLRTDFYAEVAARGRFTKSLENAQVLVEPMGPEELRSAIVEPAKNAGCAIDDDLVALLVHDVVPAGSLSGQHGSGMLPLLSHALLQTWRLRRRRRMTVADYVAAGGIAGAVEASAETAFSELSAGEQSMVERAFIRLVHLDGEKVATRRAATYAELDGLIEEVPGDVARNSRPVTADVVTLEADPHHGASLRTVTRLLEPFVAARLLTAHESTIEVTHEALLTAWPRLRGWIDEHRDALVEHRRITDAAHVWTEHDHDPSTLASGDRLAAMRAWAGVASHRMLLNSEERAFIEASVQRAADEEAIRRRGVRRLRVLAAVASALALVTTGLVVYANRARSDAETARDQALDRQIARDEASSRQISLVAEGLADSDVSLAAQLAMVAYRVAPTSQARAALMDIDTQLIPTTIHGEPGATALAVSPAGNVMAMSNAADATVQLFTASPDGYRPRGVLEPRGSGAEIWTLAFTSDDVLAIGDTDGAVTLWDVSDRARPHPIGGPIHGPSAEVQQIAVSPDGTEMAAVSATKLHGARAQNTGSIEVEGVFRWDISDISSPTELAPIMVTTIDIWAVAYSPDGRVLAHGDHNGTIDVWDVTTEEPQHVSRIEAGEGVVATLSFSPDGSTLAAGTTLGDLSVWDVSVPDDPAEIDIAEADFGRWVDTTAFSLDGRYFAAGSADPVVRVWNVSTWSPVGDLPHPTAVSTVTFDNIGGVVTAAIDGAARAWDLDASSLQVMEDRIFTIAFDQAGDRLVVASDGNVGLWEIDDDTEWKRLDDPATEVSGGAETRGTGGAISPDGSLMTRGTAESGELRLYDVSAPGEPRQIDVPQGGAAWVVQTAAFSPDQQLLAAGGDDTRVRLWDVADPYEPHVAAVLQDPGGSVRQASWSPHGRMLAAASSDSLVYLYDLADLREPRLVATLSGHDSEVSAVGFSPDGDVLATAGTDSTVQLWDVADPHSPQRIGDAINDPMGRVYDLSFHPDGHLLAAGVTDGSVWVWDIRQPAEPQALAALGPIDDPVYAIAFSPRGDVLVAGGTDGRIRSWRLDEAAIMHHICRSVGDLITEDQWAVYLPTEPYDPPCR